MKKATAVLLAVLMLIPFANIAFAANTTTLTTTVPGAVYTLNVPSDQEIQYGATSTTIAAPKVTESSGFAQGKNLYITATYSTFSCTTTDTTIPFVLKCQSNTNNITSEWSSGKELLFYGNADGTVESNLTFYNGYTRKATTCLIDISSIDWGKAAPGTYTATITFTTEVANNA